MRYILLFALALVLTCCTDNEQFRVNGVIEGNPTINLRVAYYADGAYQTQITAAREGKFEFYGSSRQPTVVEIYDYEYRLLGRVYAANGQTLDVKLARSNPYDLSVDGNETAKAWADFLRANADSLRADNAKANDIIGRYIAANPASTVSTLLLLTSFDSAAEPLMADSLLGLIAPEARPSALTDGYNYLLQKQSDPADRWTTLASVRDYAKLELIDPEGDRTLDKHAGGKPRRIDIPHRTVCIEPELPYEQHIR